jgi:hypothetical protein
MLAAAQPATAEEASLPVLDAEVKELANWIVGPRTTTAQSIQDANYSDIRHFSCFVEVREQEDSAAISGSAFIYLEQYFAENLAQPYRQRFWECAVRARSTYSQPEIKLTIPVFWGVNP